MIRFREAGGRWVSCSVHRIRPLWFGRLEGPQREESWKGKEEGKQQNREKHPKHMERQKKWKIT